MDSIAHFLASVPMLMTAYIGSVLGITPPPQAIPSTPIAISEQSATTSRLHEEQPSSGKPQNADNNQMLLVAWTPIKTQPQFSECKRQRLCWDGAPFPSDVDPRSLAVAMLNSSLTVYAKDSSHVYYLDPYANAVAYIPVADPKTFIVLYSDIDAAGAIAFAEDKDHLFRGPDAIGTFSMIDQATFSVLVDQTGLAQYWAKDEYHVYDILRYAQATSSIHIVSSADPATCAPVFLEGKYTPFAKDLNHVFYADRSYYTTILANANPVTFTILDAEYAKDSKNVWFMAKPVRGADSSSFNVINTHSFTVSHYAKDINTVYIDGKPIAGSDSASFQLLPVHGLTTYFKDKAHVYYESGYGTINIVIGADPGTFVTVANQTYDAEDAHHRYFAGRIPIDTEDSSRP
jgi:hypothetical protein